MAMVAKIFMMSVSLWTGNAFSAVISIRADEWCPFNCEPGKTPGYGIEIFTEAMKAAGHTVDYKIEPWARALGKAKAGKYHAVIGANTGEVAEFQLKTGAEPIALSEDCVFVRDTNTVKFKTASDLSQFKRVGIINDYDYSESIQSWLEDPQNASRVDAVAGDDPVALNLRKLEGGRIDAILEDKSVMEYKLSQLSMDKKVIISGCLKPAKLFIAFSGVIPESLSLIKALDSTIAKMRASGQLNKILARYGVKDWKH